MLFVQEEMQRMHQTASYLTDQLAKEYCIKPDESPAVAFGMIYNKLTIQIEVFAYYLNVWNRKYSLPEKELEDLRGENAQRVIQIQKMSFIEILSTVEYALKEYVDLNAQRLKITVKGRMYIRRILEELKSKGFIVQTEFERWEGLIELRNAAVHNNAISELTKTYIYPKCTLSMVNGSMIGADLFLFPYLIEWLMDELYSLLVKLK